MISFPNPVHLAPFGVESTGFPTDYLTPEIRVLYLNSTEMQGREAKANNMSAIIIYTPGHTDRTAVGGIQTSQVAIQCCKLQL